MPGPVAPAPGSSLRAVRAANGELSVLGTARLKQDTGADSRCAVLQSQPRLRAACAAPSKAISMPRLMLLDPVNTVPPSTGMLPPVM